MKVFKTAQMDIFEKGVSESDCPCEVHIDAESLVVHYLDKNVPCTYQGRADGAGHFRLEKVGSHGHASLHRFEEGGFLEGYWEEGARKGMWRITLEN